ncbi:DUF6035 family protein [Pedobacter agri]|uniref:DUF6035 family protein n=1 Tax=Pedobacter agri TaxID=454586 RepID=UPI00292CDB46|nr:DUF6035 family protein [Pedobacter agri]
MIRSVKFIRDTMTNQNLWVSELCSNQKDGFSIRDKYSTDTERYECIECGQKLVVAHSSKDNVYFRHKPEQGYCLLKDERFDDKELNEYYSFLGARESERHKYLKNRIGASLKSHPDIVPHSVNIDSSFIIRGKDKRKPDVYCRYGDLEVVFEIQLSELSLSFIKKRAKFYSDHGIFLVWVLDTHGQPTWLSTMQRDIKYLFPSQNLFSIDEQFDGFQLLCSFKQPFIYNDIEVRDKWVNRIVSLSQLNFDQQTMEVYLKHYESSKTKVDLMLADFKEKQAVLHQEQLLNGSLIRINALKAKIKSLREKDLTCYGLIRDLDGLSEEEIGIFNRQIDLLNFKKNGVPAVSCFISEYRIINAYPRMNFVEFLLREKRIEINLNLTDANGLSSLVALYANMDLLNHRYILLPLFFNRGYYLTQPDREYLMGNAERLQIRAEEECLKLEYYNSLSPFDGKDPVYPNLQYFYFIASAINNRIIGSNLKHWVMYMMPILSKYKTYWKYTKVVLERTTLGEVIKTIDKKKTMEKKILEFNLESQPQDEGFRYTLYELFPEVFY